MIINKIFENKTRLIAIKLNKRSFNTRNNGGTVTRMANSIMNTSTSISKKIGGRIYCIIDARKAVDHDVRKLHGKPAFCELENNSTKFFPNTRNPPKHVISKKWSNETIDGQNGSQFITAPYVVDNNTTQVVLLTEDNLGWPKTRKAINPKVEANLKADIKEIERMINDDATKANVLKTFMDAFIFGNKID